jgi:L-cysteine:1D-myo-inositol 2-amino-2-deoxy-alpha-D-glucopyranoside ligase
MYVCGITPYDATHLGHAATYVTFDVVNRVLRDLGHDVHYVQNVTDVDDPLFERADRDGVDWRDLGARETQLFREDMSALRVLPPRDYIGAVESVDEVIEVVDKLLASGAAYVVDDAEYPDVYFRVDATEQFGYESGYDRATMDRFFAERGGDPDRAGKRDPLDALLWRAARPGEPSWDSPHGPGRPGWHIECSAIALNRLGVEFDIQGGGNDLIFPHHEFSAAHGEALTDSRRFARHYVHTGMVGLDGEKMSKSRGNLVFVSHLRRDGVDPAAVRLALLSEHYRGDRMWTDGVLDAARERLRRWRAAVTAPNGPDAASTIARVRQHLADDLDTPKALAAIDAWCSDVDLGLGSSAQAPADMARAVDALLGVDLTQATGRALCR